MSANFLSKGFFVFLIMSLASVFVAASDGPPPGLESIISAKRNSIHRYHFKDENYGCEICHGNQQGKNYKLQRKESDVCYQCHAKVDDARWAHGPVGVGQCSVCHDPHGSKNEKFLVRKGEELCMFCHDRKRLQKHITTVDSNDCTACHDSHGSDNNSLLRR